MNTIDELRNVNLCWAGLLHEPWLESSAKDKIKDLLDDETSLSLNCFNFRTATATAKATTQATALVASSFLRGSKDITGPLALSSSGVLYGPTRAGGTSGAGTIFAIKP